MNPESMLKGRMAESLVENLLRDAGNQVYRFGYESVLQNLTQLENIFNKYGEVGEQIRAIPDFLVINGKGEPFFVEVKFRWQPEWHEGDLKTLERIDRFWKATIIFVNCSTKPYFMVSRPPYVDENKKLKAEPLYESEEFGFKNSKINLAVFDGLVEKYLSVTLNKNFKK